MPDNSTDIQNILSKIPPEYLSPSRRKRIMRLIKDYSQEDDYTKKQKILTEITKEIELGNEELREKRRKELNLRQKLMIKEGMLEKNNIELEKLHDRLKDIEQENTFLNKTSDQIKKMGDTEYTSWKEENRWRFELNKNKKLKIQEDMAKINADNGRIEKEIQEIRRKILFLKKGEETK